MAEGPSSEPSEAEKAGVRAQLRGTLDKLNENRSNLTQTNSRGLCEVQKQTNEIWGKTKTDARSAALDAAVLHQASVGYHEEYCDSAIARYFAQFGLWLADAERKA